LKEGLEREKGVSKYVDKYGDDSGFSDPRASEQTRSSAALQRGEHVNGFDAGFEDFRFCGLL
jgi:hypothetical protein